MNIQCPECNGFGLSLSNDICPTCKGTGELDWVEKICGKKLIMIEPVGMNREFGQPNKNRMMFEYYTIN